MFADATQWDIIKIAFGAILVVMFLVIGLLRLASTPSEIMAAIKNKINIARFLETKHEGVIHYDGTEAPLSTNSKQVEFAILLTRHLGVIITPNDFVYCTLTDQGGMLELNFKFSRTSPIFYGVGKITVIQKIKIRTDSIITNTVLLGL